jgi:membrane protein required for colicin V production
MTIAGSVLTQNFGSIAPKVGYLVAAFIIYRIMSAIGKALRGIREVPVLGAADRIMGAVMGAAEAFIIVLIVEYVTDIRIIVPVMTMGKELWAYGLEQIKRYL